MTENRAAESRSVSEISEESMKRVKKRTDSGCVCEMVIYSAPDNADVRTYKKRVRFADAEQYAAFKDAQGRKRFARIINTNYSPESYKGTLTFSAGNEIFSFADARRIRGIYVRRLRRRNPDAKIIIVMGRGKSTARIHFHFIADGLSEEDICNAWTWGDIVECKHLRKHNRYNGIDHGQDYTGLAEYYWEHWTPEQGGHHYYATRNHEKPQDEKPVEIKREYSEKKPPKAPRGYKFVEFRSSPIGYLYFKFVRIIS